MIAQLPGNALTPMPAVARILAQFDRQQLGAAIEVMIALLDLADGDSDVELNGDETDNMGSEDDFDPSACRHNGPGCLLSDVPEDDDVAEDDDPGGGNVEDEGEGIDEREPDDGV